MDAPTGYKPDDELPKTLRDILDMLLRNNGLQSWQIYSHKKGLSLRLKFGEANNGGQPVIQTGSNSRICYSKKSPSQLKRDERKAQDRRVTRQQARAAEQNDKSIEIPRGEDRDSMISPSASHISCSPIPVDIAQAPDIFSPLSLASLTDFEGQAVGGLVDMHQVPPNTTQPQSADQAKQCSTPMDGFARDSVGAAVKSDTDNDLGEDDSDEEANEDDCEYGANLSMPEFRYIYLNPVDRRCTYCGAYKGSAGKVIMECTKDGRKVCARCYPAAHKRHRKYFVECTNNYVDDGESDCFNV